MGIFTGIRCIGGTFEYPFASQGDSATRVYKLTCICDADDYAPASYDDTMDTPANAGVDQLPVNFADANAFWVEDSEPTTFQGSVVKFTRTFANIPQERIEPNGYYAFEFPDVDGGIFIEKNSISESSSYNTSNLILTITATLSAADAENFTDGDFLLIENPNTWQFDFGQISVTKSSFSGKASKSGNTFTVEYEFFYYTLSGNEYVKTAYQNFTDNAPTNYIVKKQISPDRNGSAQLNSPSIIKKRYVKTNFPEGVILAQQYQNATPSGEISSFLTTVSSPLTLQEYKDAALRGEYAINAENESISRLKGNIYEISQIKVQPR